MKTDFENMCAAGRNQMASLLAESHFLLFWKRRLQMADSRVFNRLFYLRLVRTAFVYIAVVTQNLA